MFLFPGRLGSLWNMCYFVCLCVFWIIYKYIKQCFSWLLFQPHGNRGHWRKKGWGEKAPCMVSGAEHRKVFQPLPTLITHRYWFNLIVFSTFLKLHCQLNSDMRSIVCPYTAYKLSTCFMSFLWSPLWFCCLRPIITAEAGGSSRLPLYNERAQAGPCFTCCGVIML